MKLRWALVLVLLGVGLCSLPTAAPAAIHKLYLDVFTTNNPNVKLRELDIIVRLNDTSLRPPDAVASLTVKTPGTTPLTLNLTNNCWDEMKGQFHGTFPASTFPGSLIPTGVYTATAVDRSVPPKTMTATDSLTSAWLPCSAVTYPTANLVLPTLTPVFGWTAVAGARFYRLELLNLSKEEPVYFHLHRMDVYRNTFPVPKGVLKPKTSYKLRIEARDGDTIFHKRSFSNWLFFSTP